MGAPIQQTRSRAFISRVAWIIAITLSSTAYAQLGLTVGSDTGDCETPGSITIPISISNANSLSSLGFDLTFNDANLDFVRVDRGNAVTDWGTFTSQAPSAGVVKIGGFRGSGNVISGSGVIANVVFDCVVCPSTTPLTLTNLTSNLSSATVTPGQGTCNIVTPSCFTLNVLGGSATTTQNCTGGYTSGTVVTLVATVPSGKEFDRWTGDSVANALSATTTITMDGNKSVTATFKDPTPACFTLQVSGGSATTAQNCTGGYTNGTVVTLVANVPSGKVFDRWTGDSVANPLSATTTITMNGNKSVTATFKNSTASCNSLNFFSQDGTDLVPVGNTSVTLSVVTDDCDWTISATSSSGTWWYSYLTAGNGSTEFEFNYPPNDSGQSRQVTLTATLTQTGVTRSVTLTQPAQGESNFISLNRTVYYGNCWERSGWVQVPGASRVWLVVETAGVESDADHLYVDGVEYYGGGTETTSSAFGDTIYIDLSSDESAPGYFYIVEVWYEGNATGSPILGGAIFSDSDDDCIDPCTPSTGCGATTCVKLYESHQVAFEAKSDGSDVSLETEREIAGIGDPLLTNGKVWNLQPHAAFDAPMTVQVPLPDGLDGDDALVLYFADDPEIMSWYLGENVTGWLADAPREVLGEDGARYLELTVTHGGRLQIVNNSILSRDATVLPLTEWLLTFALVGGLLAGLQRGWRRIHS